MTDKDTTIQQLKDLGRKFREERGWLKKDQKEVAISICLEAAELLEHFQWIKVDEIKNDPRWVKAVGEEISDVLVQLLELVDRLGIDLATVYEAKAKKMAAKYPLTEFNPNKSATEQLAAYYQVKIKTRIDHPFREDNHDEK